FVGFTTRTRLIESRALGLTTGSAACTRSRRKQARPRMRRPPQPISNQYPCSPAWSCI
ncbi:unnamed protein product, partial [Hymenolepis diminuta]